MTQNLSNGQPKRSVKSKMKKRPQDWEAMKVEIAQELGLWDKVCESGWSGLSAADSGRLGGVFAARRSALEQLDLARRQEDCAQPPDQTTREALEAAAGWDAAGPGNMEAREILEQHFLS